MIVLLVLGTSGALGFWAPVQPVLAAVSLAVLVLGLGGGVMSTAVLLGAGFGVGGAATRSEGREVLIVRR